MRLSRFALAASLLLLAARASAQPPDAGPKLTLMEQLDRFADGKPLPLVVAAYGHQTRAPHALVNTAGKDWLASLQAFAATVSPAADRPPSTIQIQENYIPFQLGKVWTLAADRQWKLSLNLDGADMYAATSTEDLKAWLVHSMTSDQLVKAGAEGVRWDDWTEDQQVLFAALMRRPFQVANAAATSLFHYTGADAGRRAFPVARSTFRLRLEFPYLRLPTGNNGGGAIYQLPQDLPGIGFEWRSDVIPGTNVPFRVAESARLKPGDLNFDADALNAPIGIRGVTTLKNAVAAAAKATGQDLRLSPEFDKMPVFIGDASLRTGDALKAFTFGMQGAWRKVGSARFLAWDRVGRGAVRRWEEEAVRPLEQAMGRAKNAMVPSDANRIVIANVHPDPDDPLAPTPEQVRRLTAYGPRDPQTGEPSFEDLTFADMTPAQQAVVRGRIKDSPQAAYSGVPSEEDMQRLTIRSLLAAATLEAPGIGTLRLGEMTELHRQFDVPPAAPPKPADWPPKDLPADGSLSLAPAMRAVAAPMLLRSEWPRLIEQMRRKGLNTLYVPVLWDGETLLPSRFFPQPDALRGHDALAEILSAAAPAGIKVVAVLHTLTWRFPGGSEVHWMRRHADWLDVDILGRTRRTWYTPERAPSGPGNGEDWAEDTLVYSDHVQPGNSAVREKLMGLVGELRHYPSLAGVALDHWMRTGGRNYEGPAPPLGFTLPERAAALQRSGVDPVDIYVIEPGNRSSFTWLPDPWEPTNGSGSSDDFAAARYDADAALASDMLTVLRETWPGRVELFNPIVSWRFSGSRPGIEEGASTVSVTLRKHRPLPAADAVISSSPAPGVPGQYRWLPAPRTTADERPNAERFARAAVRIQRLTTPPAEGKKPLSGVVLDFTTAPDLLWPCLRLLANAPAAPRTAAGGAP